MTEKKRSPEDHDSPWKEALGYFFQPFLQLLYPDIHAAIDWSQPLVFLDKELQKITSNSSTGRRYADKLAKVRFRDGQERWLLVHVEIQGKREAGFPRRMFVYYYRILDHYRMAVISLAVLADTDPDYRPGHFEEVVAGSGVHFRFRTVKLLDSEPVLDEQLASGNPFALLVAAQLTAKRVKDGKQRVDNLIGFYRLAIRQQLDRELIERLLVFLEWLVALPPEIEDYYTDQVDRLKEGSTVSYVSILERRGIKQGMELGERNALTRLLARRFGPLDAATEQRLQQASAAELERWVENILDAQTLEEVFILS